MVGVMHTPEGLMDHRQVWAECVGSNMPFPFSTRRDNLKVSHPGSGTGPPVPTGCRGLDEH